MISVKIAHKHHGKNALKTAQKQPTAQKSKFGIIGSHEHAKAPDVKGGRSPENLTRFFLTLHTAKC